MSRGYEARRKTKRRQARNAAEPRHRAGGVRSWRPGVLIPVLVIIAIFAAVGVLGFGAGSGKSQRQIAQEVTELLADVPQEGAVLGSPNAPITVQIFADLECPTVRLFAEKYLPGIVNTWVRTGVMKLEYRSLQTDTFNESTFFRQEMAALAAGRQNKMWNFIGTFVREQGQRGTEYATDEFLAGIAFQVPSLKLTQWRHDRKDALLSKRVALGIYSGHAKGFDSTPSFQIELTGGEEDQSGIPNVTNSLKREVEDSLQGDIESLDKETSQDEPVLRAFGNYIKES